MTGNQFDKLLVERGDFVIVHYLIDYDEFMIQWYEANPENLLKFSAYIAGCKESLDHKKNFFYPQIDDEFIYILCKHSIPIPLTPLFLNVIVKDAARHQKGFYAKQKTGQ